MIRRAYRFLAARRDALVAAWGIACATAGLVIATGVIGPTLDHHETLTTQDGRGKTAYAAR